MTESSSSPSPSRDEPEVVIEENAATPNIVTPSTRITPVQTSVGITPSSSLTSFTSTATTLSTETTDSRTSIEDVASSMEQIPQQSHHDRPEQVTTSSAKPEIVVPEYSGHDDEETPYTFKTMSSVGFTFGMGYVEDPLKEEGPQSVALEDDDEIDHDQEMEIESTFVTPAEPSPKPTTESNDEEIPNTESKEPEPGPSEHMPKIALNFQGRRVVQVEEPVSDRESVKDEVQIPPQDLEEMLELVVEEVTKVDVETSVLVPAAVVEPSTDVEEVLDQFVKPEDELETDTDGTPASSMAIPFIENIQPHGPLRSKLDASSRASQVTETTTQSSLSTQSLHSDQLKQKWNPDEDDLVEIIESDEESQVVMKDDPHSIRVPNASRMDQDTTNEILETDEDEELEDAYAAHQALTAHSDLNAADADDEDDDGKQTSDMETDHAELDGASEYMDSPALPSHRAPSASSRSSCRRSTTDARGDQAEDTERDEQKLGILEEESEAESHRRTRHSSHYSTYSMGSTGPVHSTASKSVEVKYTPDEQYEYTPEPVGRGRHATEVRLAELQASLRALERERDDLLQDREELTGLRKEFDQHRIQHNKSLDQNSQLQTTILKLENDRKLRAETDSHAYAMRTQMQKELGDCWRLIFELRHEKATFESQKMELEKKAEHFEQDARNFIKLTREHQQLKHAHATDMMEVKLQRDIAQKLMEQKAERLTGRIGEFSSSWESEVKTLRRQLREVHEQQLEKEETFRIEMELKDSVIQSYKAQYDESLDYISQLEAQYEEDDYKGGPDAQESRQLIQSSMEDALKKQISRLQQELHNRDEQVSVQKVRIEDLEGEAQLLREENKEVRGQLATACERIQGTVGPFYSSQNLLESYYDLQRSYSELADRLDNIVQEEGHLMEQNQKLLQQQRTPPPQYSSNPYGTPQSSNAEVRVYNVDLQHLYDESQDQLKRLRVERNSYLKRYHGLQVQHQHVKDQVMTLKQKSMSWKEDLENQQVKANSLEDELSRVRFECQQWRDQVSQKNAELAKLETTMQELVWKQRTISNTQGVHVVTSSQPMQGLDSLVQAQNQFSEIRGLVNNSTSTISTKVDSNTGAIEDLLNIVQRQGAIVKNTQQEVVRLIRNLDKGNVNPEPRNFVPETAAPGSPESLDEPMERWEVNFDDATRLIKSLREDLQSTRDERDAKQRALVEMQQQVSDIRQSTEKATETFEMRLQDKENLIEQHVNDLKSLQKEHADLEDYSSDLGGQLNEKKQFAEDLERKLTESQEQVRTLNEKIDELQELVSHRELELVSQVAANQQETRRLEGVIEEKAAVKKRLEEVQNDLQVRSAELADAQKENLAHQENIQKLSVKQESLEEINRKLAEDVGKVAEDQEAVSTANELRSVVAQLGRDLDDLREELRRATEEKLHAEERLRQFQETKVSKLDEMDTMKDEQTAPAQNVDQPSPNAVEELQRLQDEINYVNEEKKMLEDDNATLLKRCQALKSMYKQPAAKPPTEDAETQTIPDIVLPGPETAELATQTEPIAQQEAEMVDIGKDVQEVEVQTDDVGAMESVTERTTSIAEIQTDPQENLCVPPAPNTNAETQTAVDSTESVPIPAVVVTTDASSGDTNLVTQTSECGVQTESMGEATDLARAVEQLEALRQKYTTLKNKCGLLVRNYRELESTHRNSLSEREEAVAKVVQAETRLSQLSSELEKRQKEVDLLKQMLEKTNSINATRIQAMKSEIAKLAASRKEAAAEASSQQQVAPEVQPESRATGEVSAAEALDAVITAPDEDDLSDPDLRISMNRKRPAEEDDDDEEARKRRFMDVPSFISDSEDDMPSLPSTPAISPGSLSMGYEADSLTTPKPPVSTEEVDPFATPSLPSVVSLNPTSIPTSSNPISQPVPSSGPPTPPQRLPFQPERANSGRGSSARGRGSLAARGGRGRGAP